VLGSPAYHEPATHRVISSACRALRASKAYEAYSAGPALLQTPPDRSPNLVQSPPSAGRAHAFPLPPLALTLAAAAWLLSNGLVRSAGLLDAAAFSLIWRRSPARAGRTGTHSSGAVRRPHSRCPMEPLPNIAGPRAPPGQLSAPRPRAFGSQLPCRARGAFRAVRIWTPRCPGKDGPPFSGRTGDARAALSRGRGQPRSRPLGCRRLLTLNGAGRTGVASRRKR
jgi:hypothetical protein